MDLVWEIMTLTIQVKHFSYTINYFGIKNYQMESF